MYRLYFKMDAEAFFALYTHNSRTETAMKNPKKFSWKLPPRTSLFPARSCARNSAAPVVVATASAAPASSPGVPPAPPSGATTFEIVAPLFTLKFQ